ncbi:RNA 2',3'-cyclic phosphodiesterase [Ponticaulis sp.]|uniref:RNA 2',3'-cyclic phosphodiesterase n=1 Tax=Ponticaulis sp. TaxID=2020902 RepID=UPI000B750D76|nr:RNA 2',3'-cyclic phosphodiesterase [Ponticaulis sp.]MAI89820.1 RNA 2',3'-cyclic phosphodiesterase [Ponticaulis sp.]OUX99495.1 MAG: 2'-5' RNA ligase [Hyphomonadaceae bacterium TMED5]|tara:strand:+ start:53286 stop:53870 length:585 start_codon:yes stop_codon:yes gene_type:complete
MYRLFAAVEIPRDIGEALQAISHKVTGASWRPIENYHITLRFFGELDRHTAEELDRELGEIDAPQMQLRLKGAGWFGASEPHSIWAGVAPDDGLTRLASKCERAARRIGLPRDKRSFRPHVTLAYCHGTSLEEAMVFSQKHSTLDLGPFWVDRFHLYSSWSGKGPSRYVSEAEYPLGPIRNQAHLPDGNRSNSH